MAATPVKKKVWGFFMTRKMRGILSNDLFVLFKSEQDLTQMSKNDEF